LADDRSKLSLFDVVNLVVGAIIGADIYVASSFGAGLLGPGSLIVWVLSGIIAIVLALCFAQCASLVPKVGGTYAYAREAWGPFAGYTVGWSLWLAEWFSLAVFPVAFVRYLQYFIPNLDLFAQIIIKTLFVGFLALTNIIGAKAAGRTNDVLTIIKLAPLVLFSGAAAFFVFLNPSSAAAGYSPFLPFGLSNFGPALVLIFWAYAGFEIAAIPANEIKDAGRTIPRAIITGIAIVLVFYLVTNALLFAVRPWTLLATDTTPLTTATAAVLSPYPLLALVGVSIVGIGALISIAGSDESGMIGTASLGYALAVDGLFPKPFAKLHPRYKTPYLGILIQSVTALIASIIGQLNTLVATSVFLLAIAYATTSASIFPLRGKNPNPPFRLRGGAIIPVLGILFSFYLITQCTLSQIAIGAALLLAGIPIYIKFSPKKEMTELKRVLTSREEVYRLTDRLEHNFLAHPLFHIKRFYRAHSRKAKPNAS
jgi:amino acid transporter